MKKVALLFIAAGLLNTSAFAQRFGKLLKETPGMVSYTMRNQFAKDVPGTLDKIKGMGITHIEFSSLFGKTAADIRKELDARGMRCTSFGVGYNDLMKAMPTVVQNAKTLGAKYVRLGSIPHNGPFTLDMAKKTVEEFNAIGKQLREADLTFVYHNHGFEFEPYQNGTLFDYVVQNTNPQDVSFEMDVVWVVNPGQNPVALLEKYPTRFRLMHLKDLDKSVEPNMKGSAPNDKCVVLGTGKVDFPSLLKAARKTKIEYFYVEDENLNSEQQVPQSLAYLKSL
ncbi:sugar phosphate isomerase/epimerase family protein [Tellurirhabdus rosea]|uniref:sugar phosphate isomerase/epimerase family protein n=1 Tax=Tellurirhabdus rosea TaxID=2674997 RepID=UPI0022584805|nr:sugar phosphate isomerase/epimerase [Tellurirhabdus rosea]